MAVDHVSENQQYFWWNYFFLESLTIGNRLWFFYPFLARERQYPTSMCHQQHVLLDTHHP